MRTSTLLARNLAWYWRTNLAVLLGVATATGVLGGALLVGDSVRGSLRGLVLERLGNAAFVVTRGGFFGEHVASEMQPAAPLIVLEGVMSKQTVEVYGVDERFWKFQGWPGAAPRGREVLLTPALAQGAGNEVLLRIAKSSAIPIESLHGRKEDNGKTLRLHVSGVVQRPFSLRTQQGEVRAVYVALAQLQREVVQAARVNTVIARHDKLPLVSLDDLGVRLRGLSVETDSMVISDALAGVAARTAQSFRLHTVPMLSYLVNTMRSGSRETPYSVVTALDSGPAPAREDGIVLNEWAAHDLSVAAGAAVELEYFVWKPDGRLVTERSSFQVERVVPLDAADRDWTPEYPGITESGSLHDWDPPFPMKLSRVRPKDEEYWDRYRATPKAFVRLSRGRAMWGTRFGSLTSLRLSSMPAGYGEALRAAAVSAGLGLTVIPVKAQSLDAAQGSTDFGEYFVYFSFFLMISALLLTGLFFRLGVEQRRQEIGVLRALGFSASKIRSLFLMEGAVLAVAGSALGIAVALGYGELLMFGLRTWWIDAVGTRLLTLHASPAALAAGAIGGVIVGLLAVAWTLRGLQPASARGLLAGIEKRSAGRRRWIAGIVAAASAVVLMMSGLEPTLRFFGVGSLLLIAGLLLQYAGLHSRRGIAVRGRWTLGLRNVAYRPGRSVLCLALIASATFVIVSLDAFRRDGDAAEKPAYSLVAESVLPIVHDPNSAEGREALNLPAMDGVAFLPFRMRAGDDTSCLNLFAPRSPRILGAPAAFLRGYSMTAGDAIPAIADANSMTYVMHRKLGEEFEVDGVRLRIVEALQDSLFQGELIIPEQKFLKSFPDVTGYRFFLITAPRGKEAEVARVLSESLADYGFAVQPSAARLATFHRVENAYLDTFRALGGLGLLLGTVGLAAVLLRNILERRRELALLRAVGYRPRDLAVMVLVENLFLLVAGLVTGALCALVAVAPAVIVRGGHLPATSLSTLLVLVLAVGMAASFAATSAALRSPVLDALRSE